MKFKFIHWIMEYPYYENQSRNRRSNNVRSEQTERSGVIDETRPAPYVVFYRSEIDYISRCILDYKNIETGGQLFGLWTSRGIPVIMYAIGPGRNANHQQTFFNQDLQYLREVGLPIIDHFHLEHMGEWHSHHQLGLAHPSGHDASNIIHNMQRERFRRFVLCIGNCNPQQSVLNAFTFHEQAFNEGYFHAPLEIIERTSPFRPIIDFELGNLLIHPMTQQANHGQLFLRDGSVHRTTPDYDTNYWLNDKRNNIVLRDMIEFLKQEAQFVDIKVQLDSHQHVWLKATREDVEMKVQFPDRFPDTVPLISYKTVGAEQYVPFIGKWNYSNDILSSFKDYISQIRISPNEQSNYREIPIQ